MTPDQAPAVVELARRVAADCRDAGLTQPGRKLTNWQDRSLIALAYLQRPSRQRLVALADRLGLPSQMADRWCRDFPDAVAKGKG